MLVNTMSRTTTYRSEPFSQCDNSGLLIQYTYITYMSVCTCIQSFQAKLELKLRMNNVLQCYALLLKSYAFLYSSKTTEMLKGIVL